MIQAGDILSGYRVESIIGRGGMGVVYRAHQLSMERAVALKVLSGKHVQDESFRERFRREGRIAAQLDHPNILPVFEAGEADGHLFIAMRLIDGPTMGDLIYEQGVLRWQRVLEILTPIASALDAAAGAGLVHRDVKPQNILISSGGHPYLADFGLMRLARTSEVTRSGEWLGSPDYAAPEHMTDAVCTAAVDVYSLTAVAFHALTGHVAFDRRSDLAVLHAHATEPRPRIATFNPDVPSRLDEVIAWGMAMNPAERASSAGVLIEELAQALRSAPVEAVLVKDAADDGSGGRIPRPTTDSIKDEITPQHEPAPLTERGPMTETDGGSLLGGSRTETIVEPPPKLPDPPPDAPSRGPSRARPLLLGAGIVVALAAVALGAFVMLDGDGDAEARQVQRASFAIELASAWHLRPAVAFPTLRLSDRVTAGIGPPGARAVTLEAGRLDGAREGPDPLPVAHERRWQAIPSAERVMLGAIGAMRYDAVLDGGAAAERTYVVPTTKGYRVVACHGAQTTLMRRACDRVAATLEIREGTAVAPGPSAKTARAVAGALTLVDEARARRLRAMASKDQATRARAARALAVAHRQAAATIAKTPRGPQDGSAVRALGRALTGLAQGLDRLAAAVSSGNGSRYNDARRALSQADGELRRSLAAIRAAGYAVKAADRS